MTDTAKLAHVFLPAASGAEKSGSFTSADNRVQCFSAAVKPAGDSRTDANILTVLYGLVAPNTAKAPKTLDALHHEITTLTGLYSDVCEHDGCSMGRIKSRSTTYTCSPLAPHALIPSSRPFALTIGPIQHHNGSMTTKSENNLLVVGEAYVELSGPDAASLGIVAGDTLTLTSDTGSISLKALVSEQVRSGSLFVPAHFSEAAINTVTDTASFPQYVSLLKA